MKTIDSILYIPDVSAFSENPMPEGHVKIANGKALIYTRTTEPIDDPRITVLAETQYTGTGTSDRVYAQIQSNGDKMALYSSVHNLEPIEIDDGEGGTQTITPPFKFGMLAESELPPSKAYTYKTDIWQRCTDTEAEALDSALNAAPARQRRMWSDALSIEHSSEYYGVLRDQMVSYFGATRASEILAPSDEGGIYTALPEQDSGYVESSSGSGVIESDSGSGIIGN